MSAMNRLTRSIPNLLSLTRLLLLWPLIYFLAHDRIASLIIVSGLILLTDFLDGFLARRWNTVSDQGKILDPLADKICSAAAAIALVAYRDFPLWLLLLIVARDLLILLAGLVMINRKGPIPVSNLTGKIAMVVISITMIIYLFRVDELLVSANVISVVVIVISSFSYGRVFIRRIGRRDVQL